MTAGPRPFGMEVTDTTMDGWMVSVTSADLQSFYMECDDYGCWRQFPPEGEGAVIAAGTIHVRGGAWWWDDPNMDNPTTFTEGTLSGTPLTIMTGPSVAWGSFSVDEPQPAVWLDVPANTPAGHYLTTLTYTITGVVS